MNQRFVSSSRGALGDGIPMKWGVIDGIDHREQVLGLRDPPLLEGGRGARRGPSIRSMS